MTGALVFDIDGVLVHPWRFRDLLAREHGISPEMTRPFFQGPFRDCVLGRSDLRAILPPFLVGWGWPGTVQDFVEAWFSAENAPHTAVLGVVRSMRALGLPCFAASVQERLRARYLTEDMGLGARLDGLFFSCDLGVVKPDVAFFHEVASRIGGEPDALVFFDDHEGNVEGARAAGWRAELFVDADKLRADVERHVSRVE